MIKLTGGQISTTNSSAGRQLMLNVQAAIWYDPKGMADVDGSVLTPSPHTHPIHVNPSHLPTTYISSSIIMYALYKVVLSLLLSCYIVWGNGWTTYLLFVILFDAFVSTQQLVCKFDMVERNFLLFFCLNSCLYTSHKCYLSFFCKSF